MVQGVEELIAAQEVAFNNIKQICINYGKDGPARKTQQYLEKRISALKEIWIEFEYNHQLMMKIEDQDIPYFNDNIVTRTRKMYEDTITDMQKLKMATPGKEVLRSTPQASTSNGRHNFFAPIPGKGHNEDISATKGQELLRQQFCNFKAFERVVEKVHIESLIEQWELEDKLRTLKIKWDQIEKIHGELDYIMEEIDETYQDKYSSTEDVYEDLKKKINQKIWNRSHYDKSTPRMEIPDFYGNYNNWLSFRDLFIECVHNNPLLSKSQKMQHLKAKLKGDAEKLVQHLTVSADNYLSCWEIICHRYDNQRLLFTSYANTLFNQPSIQQASAKTIRKHHDVTLECLNGLTNIGLDTSTWDPIIVHLLAQKLDSTTYTEYIKDLKAPRDLPDLEEYIKFLEAKFMSLENMQIGPNKQLTIQEKQLQANKQSSRFHNRNYNYNAKPMNFKKEFAAKTFVTTSTSRICPVCKSAQHVLMQCSRFLNMGAHDKHDTVMKLQLCKNCLYSHGEKKCTSFKKCRVCFKPHHTLLHEGEQRNHTEKPSTSRAVNNITSNDQEVLLTTVLLKAKTIDGTYINLRALLDQGSQVSLITEDAAQRLRLPRRKMNASISGVGATSGNCKGYIDLDCMSIHSDYTFTTEVLIIKKLMNNIPNTLIKKDEWHFIDNIKLADPQFNIPGSIDVLLGADVYSNLILNGILKEGDGLPVAQQTRLGWILCGGIKTFNCFVTLNEDFSRFWETEEIDSTEEPPEADYCEEHFTNTTTRTSDGSYVVKMPMIPELQEKLGATRPQAIAQFLQLERRMKNNTEFAKQYHQFIQEYKDMGHMQPVTNNARGTRVYLPHHGVLKMESTTTKLRVVFNASQKTSTNLSLNDAMHSGPNLQKDMLSLLMNWRVYRYVITADVEKMYRYIWIHEDQRNLQTIIWRSSNQEPLQEWELCTITYGTKAAPYLAMRTLHQLAEDEKHEYPEAAEVLKNYFYMDDLVYGKYNQESAVKLTSQLTTLMKRGGFNLRKWNSNEPAVLEHLPAEQRCNQNIVEIGSTSTKNNTKTLGIRWNTATDNFIFDWPLPPSQQQTKRTLLSEISKFYDPMGWLAPIIIGVKILFQGVWLSKANWDDKLPLQIENQWNKIRDELPKINELTIPRWVQCKGELLQVHAFCDASEKAYACVMYSRTQNEQGEFMTTLIAAKTKVAPLKKKTTLPRLELCGAVLLIKLVEKLRRALRDKQVQVHCWSDSKVALAWIQSKKNKWDRYVTNRVNEIRKIIPTENWFYVKTSENPADCATRGLTPSQLQSCKLWWEGPHWLRSSQMKTNETQDYETNSGLETTCYGTTADNANNSIIVCLLKKYSDLRKITHVLAWILRFRSTLCKQNNMKISNPPSYKKNDKVPTTLNPLSEAELNATMMLIITNTQHSAFAEDIQHLQRHGSIPNRSNLLKLNPYLDEDGILRVKGRLNFSLLPKETKNPIILPAESRLTELLIHQAHHETLHGGARLTLAHLRIQYWVMGGNARIKKQLRQCKRCHRYAHHKNNQIMADVPEERVKPAKPFTNTGVDFTGHVDVKINKGRGVKTCKAYIAIFICMVTKAVHLELVSDLSTETFLAAFKRMCSRRGTPTKMFSDNGTNFVGAAKRLEQDFRHNKTFEAPEFQNEMSKLRVKWHFNAPLWPTAGGLWEAAVKSMKYHLNRVLGEQKLTFEQFTTLLAQIEACLNSRPLGPLTEDIEDLEYLTPGHFLIGGPLLAPPQRMEEHFNQHDLRNRWKLVDQMNQHIWKRWSSEYIHQLQVRSKWTKPSKNLGEGDLVLVKEENLPPGRWAMGKVVEVHPGADGYVRVATIKTKKGQIKRPITKLAPLPQHETVNSTNLQVDSNTKKSRQISTRKPKNNLANLLMLSLLAITGITTSAPITQDAQITSLKNNNPFYFDEAGRLQLVHDEWTLLVYLNITSYWKMTSQLTDYIREIGNICNNVNLVPCTAMTKQLEHQYDQFQDNNLLLQSQHLSRNKRGYFNGVGALSRTLFGTLDEEFAVKYEKDISCMKNNEDYLLKLLRNQTSIVEAQNNIIKKSESLVDSQFQAVQTYLNQTYRSYKELETRVQRLFAVNDVNTAAITASLILNNLQRVQDILLTTISDIHKGHLDVHILSSKLLMEQLHTISGKLPKGITLPLQDVEENIKKIYKLLYVRARITDNYLLLEVHIPLLSDDEYTIYRIIPIPLVSQERMKIILPSSKFIAMNLVKSTYIIIDETDIQQCSHYEVDSYICTARQPVYNLQAKNAPCEVKVFSQERLLSCNSEEVICEDNWIKLHQQNLWLYTACKKQLLRIVCGDRITSVAIYGSGIITLQPRCAVQKKDATILAHSNYGSSINMDVDLGATSVESPINSLMKLNWENSELNLTQLKSPNYLANLSRIQEAIEKQKQNEEFPSSEMSSHDIYQYSMSSILMGGALIAVIYYICTRKHRGARARRYSTTTRPGQQLTSAESIIQLQDLHDKSKDPANDKDKRHSGFNFD